MSDAPQTDPEDFEDPLSDYEPAEYPSDLHRVLAEDAISAIESKPFIQVSADTSIGVAIQKLNELKISSLLVVEGEKLVGIFTERDVLEKVANDLTQMESHAVREVMTSDPTVVYETDPVGTAVAAIAVAGHRHVPVLELNGKVMGIVSPKRVLHFLNAHLN